MEVEEIKYSDNGQTIHVKYKDDSTEILYLRNKLAQQKRIIDVLWQYRKNTWLKSNSPE